MDNMTYQEFADRIAAKRGTLLIGLTVEVDARARKTNNPYPDRKILKRYRVAVMTGNDYTRSIEKAFDRNGFMTSSLPAGQEWVVLNKLIRMTKTGMLSLRTVSTPRGRIVTPKVTYMTTEGEVIAREDALKFVPEKTFSAKQQAFAGQDQDANDQVWVRNYNFSSIKKVRLSGKTYNLVP